MSRSEGNILKYTFIYKPNGKHQCSHPKSGLRIILDHTKTAKWRRKRKPLKRGTKLSTGLFTSHCFIWNMKRDDATLNKPPFDIYIFICMPSQDCGMYAHISPCVANLIVFGTMLIEHIRVIENGTQKTRSTDTPVHISCNTVHKLNVNIEQNLCH